MGRLGVLHAAELLKNGKAPPEEVLTKVELIDLENLGAFEEAAAPSADAGEKQ
jgi:hypothetical protein